jgi:hypothetical protein
MYGRFTVTGAAVGFAVPLPAPGSAGRGFDAPEQAMEAMATASK